jgi:hypothetical protein
MAFCVVDVHFNLQGPDRLTQGVKRRVFGQIKLTKSLNRKVTAQVQ